jgi:hypothetical protein
MKGEHDSKLEQKCAFSHTLRLNGGYPMQLPDVLTSLKRSHSYRKQVIPEKTKLTSFERFGLFACT